MLSSTNIFSKEKYTIKQTDCSTKIKIIYCYVISIELAGGGDKFYFDSFIQIEILLLKMYLKVKSHLSMTCLLCERI